jgi:hypothetical protein
LKSKLPAYCSGPEGPVQFFLSVHLVMCDKKDTPLLTYALLFRLGTEKPAACIARAIIAAYLWTLPTLDLLLVSVGSPFEMVWPSPPNPI